MKEQIQRYIEEHRQELIDAIGRLIPIESLKGDPVPRMPFGCGPNAALLEALTIGEEFGFATQNHEGYVGTIDFSKDPTGLDILAHLDIVPAPPEDWTITKPFVMLEKDGKIYGRGTSDDKGPAVCALFAMKAVKDLGIPLAKNVRLILGTDEESGSEDIAYYYKHHKPAPCTFSPDADFPLINVEKGRLHASVSASYEKAEGARVLSIDCGVRPNVVPDEATALITGLVQEEVLAASKEWTVHSGLTLDISESPEGLLLCVRGIGGHAAYPETPNNALTGLILLLALLPFAQTPQQEALSGLATLFPHGDWKGTAMGIDSEDEISGYLTLSFTILRLDETSLYGEFDSRVNLDAANEHLAKSAIEAAKAQGLTLVPLATTAPHHVAEDSAFVQTLLSAYETYSGEKGYASATGGGTYVHGLENAVAFGPTLPGIHTNIHGADEFADIDNLLKATMIYAQVIIDLCGK